MPIDHVKHTQGPLKIVEDLMTRTVVDVALNGGNEKETEGKGELQRTDQEAFDLTLEGPTLHRTERGVRKEGSDLGELNFRTDEWGFSGRLHDWYRKHYAPGASATLRVSEFATSGFEKGEQFFFRLFVPLRRWVRVEDHIAVEDYWTGDNSCNLGALELKLGEETYHLMTQKPSEWVQGFVIVDGLQPQKLEGFEEKALDVLVAFGLATGKLPGDHGFFFAYREREMSEHKHFYYRKWRPSMWSIYSPVMQRSKYSFEGKRLETRKEEGDLLDQASFQGLCELIGSDLRWRAIVLLLIEAQTSSLLAMAPLLSVSVESLETLTSEGKDHEGQGAGGSKGEQTEALKEKLKEVLKEHKGTTDQGVIQRFENKIEEGSQPSNMDKLRSSLERSGVTLNKKDKKVLGKRNTFLHGGALPKDPEKEHKDLYPSFLRLYTLLTEAILRRAGYRGAVVNFPRLFGFSSNEAYFRRPKEVQSREEED